MRACITGSNGLVGSEMVKLLCGERWHVIGIDNNTRKYLFGKEASTKEIGEELTRKYPNQYKILKEDIRDQKAIAEVFSSYGPFDFIIHCAAQPAHDWSTNNALEDFQINAVGTVNILEAYRHYSPGAPFIHVSTSKVYGDHVNHLPLFKTKTRFELPKDHPWFEGIDESMSIDQSTHSLFGASKASGDLMAQEYGRYFNLPIAIFRPVCITGKSHKGAKLHGYLAYLAKCIATGKEYTINGYDGKQVRDNIHASDLVKAFYEVYKDSDKIQGTVYNIGGSRFSNNSMLEAIAQFEKLLGKRGNFKYSEVSRNGDHKWCIFSNKKFQNDYPNWKLTYDNNAIMKELAEIYL